MPTRRAGTSGAAVRRSTTTKAASKALADREPWH
ncbi:hypothetical protein H4W30_000475 [Amycolatopsis roodepoortensis]|uniref:Uncharacterized protein n=1 Tax=Amycolatopsis roodepoortensis TaxID=700274 RepID=A0ABR9KZB3_9PSEU|nr:hypothetical protein [Amycolatopsis roodepoortensis]